MNRKTHGAVSVFLVIILVPCIVITSLFVDMGRVYLGKSMSYSAVDLALNTVMSHYDYDLNDYYGFVASSQDMDEAIKKASQYFLDSLNSKKLEKEDLSTVYDQAMYLADKSKISDLLLLDCQTAPSDMIRTIPDGNLSNPALIKAQIIEFMKYRAPIELLEATGILNGLKSVSKELDNIEKDNKLIEKKRSYYEAESKLLEAAEKVYDDIEAYKKLGATKETLEQIADRLNSYEGQYREIHETLVKDLYNTDGLTAISRVTFAINNDGYRPYPYYNNGESDKRLATQSKIEDIMNDLAKSITDFISEKESIKFQEYISGSTYDIQWWAQHKNISLSKFNQSAEIMLKDYNCLVNALDFMDSDTLTAYNDENVRLIITGKDKESYSQCNQELSFREHIDWLKSDVETLYNTYLAATLTKDVNHSDKFIQNMSRLESISGNSTYQAAINASAHNLTNGKNVVQTITDIHTNVTNDRDNLQACSDALKKAIDDLGKLSEAIKAYKESFDKWDNTANLTDTDMGEQDRTVIAELEAKYAKDITPERIQELKTRLENMKTVDDTLLLAIKEMKYGSKKITDIPDYNAAKNASGIKADKIGLTKDELDSYISSSFTFLKRDGSDVSVSITAENNPNIEYEPRPKLYVWIKEQDWAKKTKDEREEGKKDHKDNEAEEKKLKEDADQSADSSTLKDIKNDFQSSADAFPSGLNMSGLDALDAFKTIVDLAIKLASDFQGAITQMRDSLYATEYVFGNFSYNTYEKEGKYETAKEMVKESMLSGYSIESINKLNADDVALLYSNAALIKEWNRTDLTFSGNKSLTNKMVNSDNNYAYGGEIEYILYGKDNDSNIKKAYNSIYVIRLVVNTVAGFITFFAPEVPKDGGELALKYDAIKFVAMGISSATGGIIPEPLARIVLIGIEVLVETNRDMKYLKAGLPVKLVKVKAEEDNWGENKEVKSPGVYFSYKDYLYVFTIIGFTNKDKANAMYARVGDVVQANMRMIIGEKGTSYTLNKAQVYYKFHTTIRVKPLMLTLPFTDGYSNNPKDSTDWCTFSYDVVRGYS